MAKLPEGFEKDYLDLLQPIISESTVKNRRNLLVASFSIVSVYLLNRSLTDLKIFGLSLEGSNSYVLLMLAASILMFWMLMFIVHAVKDFEINQERKHLLEVHVSTVKDRMESMGERAKKQDSGGHYNVEHRAAKAQYTIYLDQRERVKKAQYLNTFAFIIEYGLPLLMSAVAVFFVINNLLELFSANP